jgi:predicted transposase/invertase (TIGR01784 family)
MANYNPKIDLVFRKLFGSDENKDILLSFVNAVLEKEDQIVSLEIKNPYNLADYVKSKTSILDIKAQDANSNMYDIEMQIGELGHYGKRALYYLSKIFADQINKGEDYASLNRTIGIHLLDFTYFRDSRYKRHVVFKDYETNEIYPELNYEELYFIELPNFKKQYSEISTVLERWITFLNKAQVLSKNSLPAEMTKEAAILKAFDKLEIISFGEEEKVIYEAEVKQRMDNREELRTAIEKGIAKGKAEGLAEGKAEGIAEGKAEGIAEGKAEGIQEGMEKTARNFLSMGIDKETVARATGLTVEQIDVLIKVG